MTHDELKSWIKTHDAAFPGFRKWANQAADDDAWRARLEMWVKKLEKVPIATAIEASEAMFNRDVDLPFNRHIGWIHEHWKRQQPEPSPTFSHCCELCNGTGIVSVQFTDYERKTFGGQPLKNNVGQAACRCAEGVRVNDGRAKSPQGSQLEPFDLTRMQVHNPKPRTRSETVDSVRKHNTVFARLLEGFGLK